MLHGSTAWKKSASNSHVAKIDTMANINCCLKRTGKVEINLLEL